MSFYPNWEAIKLAAIVFIFEKLLNFANFLKFIFIRFSEDFFFIHGWSNICFIVSLSSIGTNILVIKSFSYTDRCYVYLPES